MNITDILRLSGPVLQICLVVFLIRRRAYRIFQFFFAYTIFAIITEVSKFALRGKALIYFYLSWSAEALYALLGFAALYEIFHHLFKHLYYLRSIKFSFPVTALLILALSGLWIFFHKQAAPAIPLLTIIFTLEFTVRLLQIGFFVLIFFLAVYYAEYSQHRAFGIAAGFGVSAFGIFVATLVRSETGTKHPNLLNFLPPVAYFVAVAIWLISFVRPEPPDYFAQVRPSLDPHRLLELVREWRKQAEEMVRPWFKLSPFRSGPGSH